MKKQVLFLAFLCFMVFSFAQTTPAADPTKKVETVKKAQNPAAWACPKCYKITKYGGSCAYCKVAKVQLGTYYCAHCVKATGAKAGKCPACGAATTQITRKLCSEHGSMPMKKAM